MRTTAFLIELLSRFVGAALVTGDSAIVVVTPRHREALGRTASSPVGFDVSVPLKPARYIPLDAAATLAGFMRGGLPDPMLFNGIMARPSKTRERRPDAGRGRVVAFGEMVALLWAEGKIDAALQLEEMWNRAGRHLLVLAVLRVPDERLPRQPARGAVPEDLRAAHARLSRGAAPLFRISLTSVTDLATQELRNVEPEAPQFLSS